MGFGYIRKLFKKHSVCVTGMRGSGKDMLLANVLARMPSSTRYASNIDYRVQAEFLPLELDKLNCGCNTYADFIKGDLKPYSCPYPEDTIVILSDVGVYLPSQYCSELNRHYPYLPTQFALNRQILNAPIHLNVQNLNRCWDKLREMSDVYLYCRWCKVFGNLVFQYITEYDKASSCIDRVQPCAIKIGLFDSPDVRTSKQLYIDSFRNKYGLVKNHLLIYFNKSNYDTRHFKSLLGVTFPESEEYEN